MKTLGSRETGDLRPEISDNLPHGLNYLVLEYDETAQTCVVEAWCSNHLLLKAEDRKNMVDLQALDKHPATVKTLPSHAKSPKTLGRFALSVRAHSPPNAEVDKEKKTVKFQGRQGPYKRMVKQKTTDGTDEELYVLDEG